MTPTTCHMSISLDGFLAGPDQSRDNPLGVGGLELHHWHLDEPIHEADARARDELMKPRGAYVMGRNMFGPVRGPWDVNWRGWWGDEPPYHARGKIRVAPRRPVCAFTTQSWSSASAWSGRAGLWSEPIATPQAPAWPPGAATRSVSADPLSQGNDDPLWPANVGHAPDVLVLTDAADQALAVRGQPVDRRLKVVDFE